MANPLSRRTLLRGLGTAVALPWLEAMGPFAAWGAAPVVKGAAPAAPQRMAFLYVPNGVNIENWTPKTEGRDYELTACLEPLKEHRRDFNVLTGLTADKARPHGDGGGDHARALGAFLTGAQPRKTDGTDIRTGVSVDQLAASRIGDRTRLPSLEIGIEQGGMAGNCDSGYSCVYSSTMSWRSATTPVPKEVNPKLVFERMFKADTGAEQEQSRRRRRSVLDAVMEDAKDLEKTLGGHDLRKLDEYLSSVRDVELRIERAAKLPPITAPEYPTILGTTNEREEKIRLMCDLMVLAFQTDVTRICTFVIANEGSSVPYKFIGVSEGHHELSHHGNDETKKEKIRKIDRFNTSQFAYLLGKLKSVREGNGTLLDNCLLAYGSGNSDGNRHNHNDLPILLAGGGGGTVKTGRHIRYPDETPLNNLWMAMLDRVDVDVPFLGDSTGVLQGLDG
ncbi:MAG: DUF1552 domain-containing protein [Planctomycetia bacterium]|nr:DUF1552 domain-containing protein [Planctomycetia bacterium]